MIKKLTLVCFTLFISFGGAVGCSSSGDSANVESNTATAPTPPPSLTQAPAPVSLSPVPFNPVAYLPLFSLHQAYAQDAGLTEDYVDLVWRAYLPGVKMPQTEKWDLPKINGFLQFVRVTGGNAFQSHNLSAAGFTKLPSRFGTMPPNCSETSRYAKAI